MNSIIAFDDGFGAYLSVKGTQDFIGIGTDGVVALTFDQATALCEAITAHIIAERAKAASEKAKAEWEKENV